MWLNFHSRYARIGNNYPGFRLASGVNLATSWPGPLPRFVFAGMDSLISKMKSSQDRTWMKDPASQRSLVGEDLAVVRRIPKQHEPFRDPGCGSKVQASPTSSFSTGPTSSLTCEASSSPSSPSAHTRRSGPALGEETSISSGKVEK